MKKLGRTILSLILTGYVILGMLTFVVAPAYAAGNTPNNLDVSFKIPNPTKYGSLEEVINAVASVAKVVFTLTFAGVILYGGFMRLTSGGEEKKVEQSTKIITAGIVGFAIIVFAQPISEFVAKLLGVQGGLFSAVGNPP